MAWGLSESGDILFEHQVSQGIYNHATVEYKPILQEVGRSKAISLYCVHNHPDGSTEPSVQDNALTSTLRESLKGYHCGLTTHEIVPAPVDRLTEAESRQPWRDEPMSLRDLREAEEARLWAPYGGRNPYAR